MISRLYFLNFLLRDVSATDKEDGDLTSEVKYEGEVDTNTPGTYTIKYTVKDSAGHLATQIQTVTVKEKKLLRFKSLS
ncbi:protein of unknown function [Bacillus toyonensis]|nr:protein of unknown function [Bacillus toyonensis]